MTEGFLPWESRGTGFPTTFLKAKRATRRKGTKADPCPGRCFGERGEKGTQIRPGVLSSNVKNQGVKTAQPQALLERWGGSCVCQKNATGLAKGGDGFQTLERGGLRGPCAHSSGAKTGRANQGQKKLQTWRDIDRHFEIQKGEAG